METGHSGEGVRMEWSVLFDGRRIGCCQLVLGRGLKQLGKEKIGNKWAESGEEKRDRMDLSIEGKELQRELCNPFLKKNKNQPQPHASREKVLNVPGLRKS